MSEESDFLRDFPKKLAINNAIAEALSAYAPLPQEPEKENLNGWIKADEEPDKNDYPILIIDGEGHLRGPYHRGSPCKWESFSDYHGVVYWFAVPLPKDAFGEAVKKGYTLT
jgi:hypothetical protein